MLGKRLSVDRMEFGVAEVPSSAVVLVCRKCCKRAGRKGLRREIRVALKAVPGSPRTRIVETGCLGICPRGGVAVASGPGMARGEIVVMGEAAAADTMLAGLRLDGP